MFVPASGVADGFCVVVPVLGTSGLCAAGSGVGVAVEGLLAVGSTGLAASPHPASDNTASARSAISTTVKNRFISITFLSNGNYY
jgi:hypothetical protein